VGLQGNIPLIGTIVTGLIASRGSNIVADLVERINSWKKLAPKPE
jgi:hypothetical protein